MPWDGSYGRFGPYVPVAQRLAQGRKKAAARAKKSGRACAPIEPIKGRGIATTVWGKAWCEHLESYSDIANRLARGRTYARNGSVVDLCIKQGRVSAMVSGSELYEVEVRMAPATPELWKAIVGACAGRIDSVVELLSGKLSEGVMSVLTDRERGLFPDPHDIELSCSCPDAAVMCKHVAATLYGVGIRFDSAPELLFTLRAVDPDELISQAAASGALEQSTRAVASHALAPELIADLFGIELDDAIEAASAPVPKGVAEVSGSAPDVKRKNRRGGAGRDNGGRADASRTQPAKTRPRNASKRSAKLGGGRT